MDDEKKKVDEEQELKFKIKLQKTMKEKKRKEDNLCNGNRKEEVNNG